MRFNECGIGQQHEIKQCVFDRFSSGILTSQMNWNGWNDPIGKMWKRLN
jgi:hypothetical protein